MILKLAISLVMAIFGSVGAAAEPACAPETKPSSATTSVGLKRPATPTQWELAAREVLAIPMFKELNINVRKKSSDKSTSPVSMALTDMGRCELNLKDRNNPTARLIESMVSAELRPVWLKAIIVHEVAHCWRNVDKPGAIDALYFDMGQASVGGDEATIARMVAAQQAEEIFADVAALSWVETAYPAHYRGVLNAFIALRQHPRLADPAHNTLPALARILRHGMLYGETPFYAADTTLAVLKSKGWERATSQLKR